jgi:hypothetical protein
VLKVSLLTVNLTLTGRPHRQPRLTPLRPVITVRLGDRRANTRSSLSVRHKPRRSTTLRTPTPACRRYSHESILRRASTRSRIWTALARRCSFSDPVVTASPLA